MDSSSDEVTVIPKNTVPGKETIPLNSLMDKYNAVMQSDKVTSPVASGHADCGELLGLEWSYCVFGLIIYVHLDVRAFHSF